MNGATEVQSTSVAPYPLIVDVFTWELRYVWLHLFCEYLHKC